MHRDVDAETGRGFSLRRDAAESDGAVVFLHDALADPEAESSSLRGLGGEEGLEEMPGVFCLDSGAGVTDGDRYVFVEARCIGALADGDAQLAAVGHGLNGVGDEVHEDLPQLAGKSLKGGVAEVALFELDVLHLDVAELQLDDVVDDFGDGDGDGLLGFAIEAQCLADDVRYAGELLLGHAGVVDGFGVERRVMADEMEDVVDGFERVVDLM